MTPPQLLVVPPAQLRSVWPLVRDRIGEIAAAADEPWIPDDVFHQVLVANAYLWTLPIEDGQVTGFVVLQVEENPYSKVLRVWVAHNDHPAGAAVFFEQLRELARLNHCERVFFISDRGGFDRLIPGLEVRYHYSMGV